MYTHSQVEARISTENDIESVFQWPKLGRDALPGPPPHNHRVSLALRRVFSRAREKCEFFGESPWKGARDALHNPNPIGKSSSDDDGSRCHGTAQ